MMKLKVKREGREGIYIPERKSLKAFIKARKLKQIHNFIACGPTMVGADHDVESVLKDIDRADRLAVFTDPTQNMDHSLVLIHRNNLECYDIGKISESELDIEYRSGEKI